MKVELTQPVSSSSSSSSSSLLRIRWGSKKSQTGKDANIITKHLVAPDCRLVLPCYFCTTRTVNDAAMVACDVFLKDSTQLAKNLTCCKDFHKLLQTCYHRLARPITLIMYACYDGSMHINH